jgi:hypothetical protein
VVQWDARRDLPRKMVQVRGFGVADEAPAAPSPEGIANLFLDTHRQVLFGNEGRALDLDASKANAVHQLQPKRTRASLSGHQVLKQQVYRGVPVYGAEVQVNLDPRGRVLSVLSTYESGLELSSVTADLPAERALAVGRSVIDRPGPSRAEPTAQLVVLRHEGRTHLAYRTMHSLWSPYGDWEAFVDAQTGEVLRSADIMVCQKPGQGRIEIQPPVESAPPPATSSKATATGLGLVFPANPLNGQPSRYGLRDSDDLDPYRESVDLLRLDGTGFLRGDFVDVQNSDQIRVQEPSLVFEYSSNVENGPFQEVNAYWHIDVFQNYVQTELGISNANNRQQLLYVHQGEDDNSSYSTNLKSIRYGDGGVDDSEDGEIVLHEYGHAMHDDMVGISGFWSGAISEGFGDYLAATFGGNALVGEWDATSYNPGPPPYLRRTDTSKHFPESVVNQVHQDGEIISAAWWDLRDMLGPVLADRLVIESFFLTGADVTFPDFADATVQADEVLHQGSHRAAILTAYGDRGILSVFALEIAHSPLVDTADTDGPYPVSVGVTHTGSLSAPDAVQLHYKRQGDADFTTVNMAVSGSDLWTGQIPGPGTLARVEYYFTATDADGVTAFEPMGAPEGVFHGFKVGVGVPVAASGLRAAVVPAGVTVTWTVQAIEEMTAFTVLRSRNGAAPSPVASVQPQLGPMQVVDAAADLKAGDELVYQLQAEYASGRVQTLAGEARVFFAPPVPGRVVLAQNAPNPFNPRTTIQFSLPEEGPARLRVFDVSGRLVSTLVDGVLPARVHEVQWDGTDDRGHPVSTGTYFYRLDARGFTQTRKMVLAK